MQLHYTLATEARVEVIRGDLDKARAKAAELAAIEPPEMPEPWVPRLEALRVAAAGVAAAGDLLAAGGALGTLGATCGDCHAAVGGGPSRMVSVALEQPEAPGPHMRQHLWAADRMWLGLVGPSDELWTTSATALADLELHELADLPDGPEAFTRMEMDVHLLAGRAALAKSAAERAVLYGEFLGRCAACHTLVGVTPRL